MIRLIGLNKLFLIVTLSILLVLMLSYLYGVATPQIAGLEKSLRRNSANITTLSNDLDLLKSDIKDFVAQEEEFKNLEQYGFFDPQDRVQARRNLNYIKEESGVVSAQYSIRSARSDKNEKVQQAGYKILNTPMEFTLEAVDDKDIYRFMYLLNYGFPGQVTFGDISIERDKDITFAMLKQIGTGREPLQSLVKAEIKANWRTVVPDPTIAVTGGNE